MCVQVWKDPLLSTVGIIFLMSFSMGYLIVKFGLLWGLVFKQKVDTSLEGILELGNLIIYLKK